jgi:hypothetical protein
MAPVTIALMSVLKSTGRRRCTCCSLLRAYGFTREQIGGAISQMLQRGYISKICARADHSPSPFDLFF